VPSIRSAENYSSTTLPLPIHYSVRTWRRRPESDFLWSSGIQWMVRVDTRRKVWTCEVRIPLKSLSTVPPQSGTRWRANFYRIDRAHESFLASNPTLNGSFHTPERFGWLEFEP